MITFLYFLYIGYANAYIIIDYIKNFRYFQFEIVGLAADKRDNNQVFIKGTETYLDERHKRFVGMVLKGKATYARILIRNLAY